MCVVVGVGVCMHECAAIKGVLLINGFNPTGLYFQLVISEKNVSKGASQLACVGEWLFDTCPIRYLIIRNLLSCIVY